MNAQCSNPGPHLQHIFPIAHSSLKDTITFTCFGVTAEIPPDASERERAVLLLAEYRGRKVSLRIFLDGVVDADGMTATGSRPLIYAHVKTSDLVSFLKRECSEVHLS